MTDLQSVLLQYGVAGVFILCLLAAVWRLFNRYDEAQEARIADGTANRDALNNNSKAIEAHTKTVEALVAVLQARK